MSWSVTVMDTTKKAALTRTEELLKEQVEYIPDLDVLVESVDMALCLLPIVEGVEYLVATSGHVGTNNGFVSVRVDVLKKISDG